MSDRWAVLINLPPERQECFSAILAPMGIRARAMGWKEAAGQLPSDGSAAAVPALLIASVDEYDENRASLSWLRAGKSGTTVVFLAPAALTALGLRVQLQHDVLNVIPDSLWNDPVCLQSILRGLLSPEQMFDIRRFVPDAALLERFTISNLAEKRQVAEAIAVLARPYSLSERQLHDLRLITIELINNAFFHSFRDDEGESKYSPPHFLELEREDNVVVEAAMSHGAIALAVEDNQGTLNPREVLKYLRRQSSGAGVYDSHGRGFHLMSNMVDHLSVCVSPGKKARVVAMNHPGSARPIQTLNFYVAP